MEGNYNFWADLLDTFQSSPDWIKAVWLLVPPGFILALTAIVMRFRLAVKKTDYLRGGELVYTVQRTANDTFEVISHSPQGEHKTPLLLPEPRGGRTGETIDGKYDLPK